ncbi:hypothetical protein IWQ62_001792 [Dispira parvispora]|uniref:Ran guanine nucleotide release factor n=1 Tax=Dispira parvispora TaxID=1520584 RepID=A0A9W8E4J1_9FUNG|nr:hypothetical protein IWQ62_001792 [Dispira parvispora]
MSQYYEMKLYGGKIECEIPKSFENASTYRNIPDHQEVFVEDDTDQSIIVEILEKVNVPDSESAKFHFEQLAEDNEASSFAILSDDPIPDENVPELPSTTVCHMVTGKQMISKFREKGADKENYVLVYVAVLRLHEFHVDIVVSMNHPVIIAPNSSSSRNMTAETDPKTSLATFKHLLHTFRITDLGLFGNFSY